MGVSDSGLEWAEGEVMDKGEERVRGEGRRGADEG